MFVVRDKDGSVWGLFGSAMEAALWAMKKWPDVPERDLNVDGWEVLLVQSRS